MPNMAAPSMSHTRAVALVGAMFFVFGFATWMNGPLISFVKLAFDLSDVGAFLVPAAFYLSYVFLALPSATIIRKLGFKGGMVLGLMVMGLGMAAFGETTTHLSYPGALASLFVIGAGLTLLQTAVNPYISVLGPIEGAARRIALMGICNKTAGILAPAVLGVLVLHGAGDLDAAVAAAPDAVHRAALLAHFAGRVRLPDLVMAALLLALAALVWRSPLPEISLPREDGNRFGLRAPHLWLGVLCLFLYVGVEVMAGDAIGTYAQSFGLPVARTAFFTSFTLAAMLAGYVVGLLLTPGFVRQEHYLAASALLGVALGVGALVTTGGLSVGCVAAMGFANAMMWPAIFPLGIRDLGASTATGSAFMVMGISGGAIIPQLFVQLKQDLNFQVVFAGLVIPCYLYILFYAVHGHRMSART